MSRHFSNEEIVQQDAIAQLERLLGARKITEAQKESMARLVLLPSVRPEDLDETLALFSTLPEKQLLIKYFLPTTTLGELASMIHLPQADIRRTIEHIIEKGHFDTLRIDASEMRELVDKIDPNDIVIPTDLFPEDVVNAVLNSQGKKVIASEISKLNESIYDDFRYGNELKLVPDEQGHLLPAFIGELRKIGVPHPERFQAGNFFRGKRKDEDGIMREFCFVIESVEDDPVKNRENKGRGRPIMAKNVLSADGSMDKNWKTKTYSDQLSYFDLHSLFQNVMDQSQQ